MQRSLVSPLYDRMAYLAQDDLAIFDDNLGFFIRPSKTGCIMGSPVAGGVPHSLSGAYLQDCASYGSEILWVDRSHQGGVHCTGNINLACLIVELLPFVHFHT